MNLFQKRIIMLEVILIMSLFIIYKLNYLSFNILLATSILYLICFIVWFYFQKNDSKYK